MNKLIYNGLECDSLQEYYFCGFLDDLKKSGRIIEYNRCDSFLLAESVKVKTEKNNKKSSEIILQSCNYTPDFYCKLSENYSRKMFYVYNEENTDTLKNKFICHRINDEIICYFEVKPDYDWNNKTRLFKILQKWLFQTKGIFVNLVKVEDIFKKTFYPHNYLFTPSGNKRKLKNKRNFVFIEEYFSNHKSK